MLSELTPESTLDVAIQRYLQDSLGIAARVRAWTGGGTLPYFLHDAFELREMKLRDHLLLLAIERHPGKPGLAKVRGQLDKLSVLAKCPVIYVTSVLSFYQRKRLIEQKVPFIVPGNQLYLPDLGIDLREYFRQRPQAADTVLSPATQAILIAALLRKPWQVDWQPAQIVAGLGYTPMTLSRAIRELTAAGVGTLHAERRMRWLRTDRTAAETWEHAKPLMRSPVKKIIWARPIASLKPPMVRLAGPCALARYSMLAEPQWPIYAVSPAQWKAAMKTGVERVPEQTPGACEWQLWHYNPALAPEGPTVDPLSLTLSLQDEADDRVQLALDELKKHFPW